MKLVPLLLLGAATVQADAPVIARVDVFQARDGNYYNYRVPGIAVTRKGAILAWAEARGEADGSYSGDWGNIDVVLRRSTDGGVTWGPRQKLVDPGVEPAHNAVFIPDRKGSRIHFLYCVQYARCYYSYSEDDALTFAPAVDITAVFERFRPEYNWNVIATGPGHGIQLRSGRLLVPVWLSTGGRAHRPSRVSVIYSDDAGRTWQRGDLVPDTLVNPSETVAVQLLDGRVMLNIRNESPEHRRAVSFSKDAVRNWTKPAFDQQLLEPVCMGGILRLTGKPRSRILFSNPDNRENAFPRPGRPNADRKNVTVKLSYDEGRRWPVSRPLEPGPSGYSDLAVGPRGAIYCIYEKGNAVADLTRYDPAAVTVARFNLQWLTGGKDQ